MATDSTHLLPGDTSVESDIDMSAGGLDLGSVQLAAATGEAPMPVNIPRGQQVFVIPVRPGQTIELPTDSVNGLLAKLGADGNLAIVVDGRTIILQGYAAANEQEPIKIVTNDGDLVDIVEVLAGTLPDLDIQTAAGPAAAGAQGGTAGDAAGSGIFVPFAAGPLLGGFDAAGTLKATQLAYKNIDDERELFLIEEAKEDEPNPPTIDFFPEDPEAKNGRAVVSDEGLKGGLKDSDPSPDDETNSVVASGTFVVSDPDLPGDTLTVMLLTGGLPALKFGGQTVNWILDPDGHTLHGQTGGTDAIVIQISSVDGLNYDYDVTLLKPLDHSDPSQEDELNFNVGVKVTDSTGLSDQALLAIQIEDDSPVVELTHEPGFLLAVDETVDGQGGGDVDADGENGTAEDGATAEGDEAIDPAKTNVADTGLGGLGTVIGAATADADDLFDGEAGADQEATHAFTLEIKNGGLTQLKDTQTGEFIQLVSKDGFIQGVVDDNGTTVVVFALHIDDQTGQVTMAQYRAVDHGSDLPDDSFPDEVISLGQTADGKSLLEVTYSLTDKDGDSDSQTVDLGELITFDDDGPDASKIEFSVGKDGEDALLVHDETAGVQDGDDDATDPDAGDAFQDEDDVASRPLVFKAFEEDADNADDLPASPIGYASAPVNLDLSGGTPDGDAAYGSDGPGTTTIALTDSNGDPFDGDKSNLVDTATGRSIFLYTEDGLVVGRIGTAGNLADPDGEIAFAISIDDDSLDLAQYRAIKHPDTGTDDESSPALALTGTDASTTIFATITVTDEDGDQVTKQVPFDGIRGNPGIVFQDDGPRPMDPETAAVTEDEQFNPPTDEAAGVAGDPTPDLGSSVSGDVSDNGNWGVDGFDRITQVQIGANPPIAVPDGGFANVYWGQDGSYQGDNPAGAAAILQVSSTGAYTFTQLDNLLISGSGEQINLLGTAVFTGVDGDGDPETISLDLTVKDDIPGTMTAEAAAITEDEQFNAATDEAAGVAGDPTPDLGSSVSGDASDNGNWGADGFGRITQVQIDGNPAVAVPNGGSVTVYWGQDGSYQGTTAAGAAASLLVNSNGTYTFTQLDNMLISGVGEQIDLLGTATFTGQDGDGDTATISLDLKVKDDIPGTMAAEAAAITEDEQFNAPTDEAAGVAGDPTPDLGSSVSGDVSDNGNWGADGFGRITQVQIGGSPAETVPNGGSVTVYWSQAGAYQGTTAAGAAASLLVNSNGTYTFTQLDNMLIASGADELIDLLGTATFTGQDGDGDAATISLDLKVKDDIPGSMSAEAAAIVEDEQLNPATDEAAGVAGDPTPDLGSSVLGDVSDNGDWGADGFGRITQVQIGGNPAETVPNGGSVTVYWSQAGAYQGTTAAGAAASLQISSTGAYTFTLLDNMLIASGAGELIDSLGTATFTGMDGDGDQATITMDLKVKDDIPASMAAEAAAITEDEQFNAPTDEAAGVAGDPTPDLGSSVSGDVSDNGDWGADGFGGITQVQIGANTAVLVPDGGSTTVYWSQTGVYQGTTAAGAAASLLVNSGGTYTFTQLDNMLISGVSEQVDLIGSAVFTGVDGDGDAATISLDLKVKDDIPGTMTAEAAAITEDEEFNAPTDEAAGIEGDPTPDLDASVSGDVSDNGNWGADGFGRITQVQIDGNPAETVPNGGSVTVYWGQDGTYQGTTAAGAAASLLVNSGGTYTFTQLDNVLISGVGEQINLVGSALFTGIDGDGDEATISLDLKVKDDIPGTMTAEAAAITEDEEFNAPTDEAAGIEGDPTPDLDASVSGDVSDNGNWGADGFGRITQVQIGVNPAETVPNGGSVTVYWGQDGTYQGTTAAGAAASLLVNSNGTYTFTQLDNMLISGVGEQVDLIGSAVFTGIDGDGDAATISLDLKVKDDIPGTMTAEAAAITEDEEFNAPTDEAAGIEGDPTPDLDASVSGDVSDNGNWGADGFGRITQVQIDGNPAETVPNGGSVTVYWGQDGTYQGTTAAGAAASLLVNSGGTYTFTQLDNVLISGVGEQIDLLGTATFTGVDGDGDEATVALDLQVKDDIPVVTSTSNLIYANSSNPTPGGTGMFAYNIGADNRTIFTETSSDFVLPVLSGVVGTNAITNIDVDWDSEDATQAKFNFTFDYVANPTTPGVLTTATGTITFDKVAGTYTVELASPLQGFSVVTTSGAVDIQGYDAGGSSEDNSGPADVFVAQLSDGFFVQFTGIQEADNKASGNLKAGGDLVFSDGELISQGQADVIVSKSAMGIGSNTIQPGEVFDLNFYNTNPAGNLGLTQTASASSVFLEFFGIGSADLIVILKLRSLSNPLDTTTRAIIIENSDIFTTNASLPAGYGIFLDNNESAVIIESNDYNTGLEDYAVIGLQIVPSSEDITGTGIDLNSATGALGASTGTQSFDAADQETIKVVNIGFVQTTTTTLNANLQFDVAVQDADGDQTSTTSLDVDIVGGSTFTGTAAVESIQGSSGNDTITGGGGNDTIDVSQGNDTVKYTSKLDGNDVITGFDADGSGGQDKIDLDGLFDSYGPMSGTRADHVNVADGGADALVRIDTDNNIGNGYEMVITLKSVADHNTVTVGSDVLVGS